MDRLEKFDDYNPSVEPMSWRCAITLGLAPLMPVAPPIWLGYAGYSLWLVIGLGLLITFFAFFLAHIDGMKLRLSKHGMHVFASTYLQITAVLLTLFLIGTVARH